MGYYEEQEQKREEAQKLRKSFHESVMDSIKAALPAGFTVEPIYVSEIVIKEGSTDLLRISFGYHSGRYRHHDDTRDFPLTMSVRPRWTSQHRTKTYRLSTIKQGVESRKEFTSFIPKIVEFAQDVSKTVKAQDEAFENAQQRARRNEGILEDLQEENPQVFDEDYYIGSTRDSNKFIRMKNSRGNLKTSSYGFDLELEGLTKKQLEKVLNFLTEDGFFNTNRYDSKE